MTKMERLELENEVLKNVIACVQEELDHRKINPYETIGAIRAVIKYDEKMKFALKHGCALDYRMQRKESPHQPRLGDSEIKISIKL